MLRWVCCAGGAPKRRNKRGRGWIFPGIVLMLGAGGITCSMLIVRRIPALSLELSALSLELSEPVRIALPLLGLGLRRH